MHGDPPSPPAAEGADALEVLFERPGLPEWPLPAALASRYGRRLGLPRPAVIGNFVASVDGVVALARSDESGHVISGDSEADRFVMGLLRACADAVLIGAGTFRKGRGQTWRAESIYPAGAALFRETRARLGLAVGLPLVVFTASGSIDVDEPALEGGIIVTTVAAEARLRSRVPPSTRVFAFEAEAGGIPPGRVLDRLRAEGLGLVLAEGGPSLIAELLSQHLLDELFLTSSPVLFGRYPGDQRKSLVDGRDLAGVPAELLSVRRSGSHLFLRYAFGRT